MRCPPPRAPTPAAWPPAYPRGLYRLEDDGTWTSLPLDGDPSYVQDLAAGGGGLYAISTAPAADGGVKATLASSPDEGASWAPQDVELPPPPNDAVDWDQVTTLEVESTSSATLAVVSTSWRPDLASLFPETADSADLVVETTDAGYELRRIPAAAQALAAELERRLGEAAPPPVTAAPTTTAPAPGAGATTTVPAPGTTAAPTTITLPAPPPRPRPPPRRCRRPPPRQRRPPRRPCPPGATTTVPAPGTTAAPTTTTLPAPPATAAPTTSTVPAPPPRQPPEPSPDPAASAGETVRTVTWADLGVDGPEDL